MKRNKSKKIVNKQEDHNLPGTSSSLKKVLIVAAPSNIRETAKESTDKEDKSIKDANPVAFFSQKATTADSLCIAKQEYSVEHTIKGNNYS